MSKFLYLFFLFPIVCFAETSIPAEFQAFGFQNVKVLETFKGSLPDGLTPELFLAAVQGTEIRTASSLVLRGANVDAVNYPTEKLIVVDEERWNRLDAYPERKQYLVMHEYLGIMGIELDVFSVSNEIKRIFFEQTKARMKIHEAVEAARAKISYLLNSALSTDFAKLNTEFQELESSERFKVCIKERSWFEGFKTFQHRISGCRKVENDLRNMANIIPAMSLSRRISAIWSDTAISLEKYGSVADRSLGEFGGFASAATRIANDLTRFFEIPPSSESEFEPERYRWIAEKVGEKLSGALALLEEKRAEATQKGL